MHLSVLPHVTFPPKMWVFPSNIFEKSTPLTRTSYRYETWSDRLNWWWFKWPHRSIESEDAACSLYMLRFVLCRACVLTCSERCVAQLCFVDCSNQDGQFGSNSISLDDEGFPLGLAPDELQSHLQKQQTRLHPLHTSTLNVSQATGLLGYILFTTVSIYQYIMAQYLNLLYWFHGQQGICFNNTTFLLWLAWILWINFWSRDVWRFVSWK